MDWEPKPDATLVRGAPVGILPFDTGGTTGEPPPPAPPAFPAPALANLPASAEKPCTAQLPPGVAAALSESCDFAVSLRFMDSIFPLMDGKKCSRHLRALARTLASESNNKGPKAGMSRLATSDISTYWAQSRNAFSEAFLAGGNGSLRARRNAATSTFFRPESDILEESLDKHTVVLVRIGASGSSCNLAICDISCVLRFRSFSLSAKQSNVLTDKSRNAGD
mmetsp:Transcript_3128/g.5391  ORF Transcript_3128/g.5391 Transcript_3128/m.5391 type:complete len:223 (+) Transcript_3128:1957-2625(+)